MNAPFSFATVVHFVVLVPLLLRTSFATQVTFQGKETIVYSLRSQPMGAENNQITFRFKTIHPDGLILFSRGTQGDYISIDLVQGKLRYKVDLGATFDSPSSTQEAIIGVNLANNEWHTVHINRRGTQTNISVDEYSSRTVQLGGRFKQLDLDGQLFIGGKVGTLKVLLDLGLISRNYIGCLENFIMDDIDILYSVKYNKKNFRAYGDLYYGCEAIDYDPITFPTPQAVVRLPSFVAKSLTVRFKFRTRLSEGLLISKVSTLGSVYLGIRDKKLFVKIVAPKMTPLELQLGENLNDGIWHQLHFSVTAEVVSVIVDRELPVTHKGLWLRDINYSSTYTTVGGGADDLYTGFVGCIHDFFIDGTNVDFRLLHKQFISGALLSKCETRDLCWPNPCKHNGKCSQDWNAFKCDCRQTMYNGIICDDPIVQRNCQDYKYLGLKEDSYCMIDPDGKGILPPIEVICNVTDGDTAKTVISVENRKGKIKVSNYSVVLSGKYFHLVQYGANMESVERVIQESSECQQFLSFMCKSAPLMNSPRGPPMVEWVNRKGTIESYWGGATKGSAMCACGMNRTCVDRTKYCNCDKNDDVWRSDSGYLTDKEAIPVSILQIDTSLQDAYYLVGNLECSGNTTIDKTKEKYVAALRSCRPYYSKSTTTPSTVLKSSTEPRTIQREVTLTNFNQATFPYQRLTTAKPSVPVLDKGTGSKGNTANVNVNLTLGIQDSENSLGKDNNGLTISMSLVAVISISAAVVLVWIIIAIIVLVRRRLASQARPSTSCDEEEDAGPTEMCVLFRSSEKSVERPRLEIRRHSFRTDSTDTFSDIGFRGFHQPITTHIDLNYAARKKRRSSYLC